jgi:cellulose biosynthesis protein BcsQ
MLGQQGKRVLVIDLDYQRSLSLLCCSYDQIQRLHQGGRCLQHFLLHPQPDAAKLLECTIPLKRAERCEIVVTAEMLGGTSIADSLEDAEMRLMAGWLVGNSAPDVRFFLRKALHSPRIRERYDMVLLDCPPRLSTACINALAASDFALIPTLLDLTSAVSASNLLRKLRRLASVGVLSNLDALGIVANRVKLRVGEMVKSQAVVWQEMRAQCDLAWEKPVPFLKSYIKESSDVSRAADRHDRDMESGTFAAFLPDLEPMFSDLVKEIIKRIGNERKRLEAVPA